jgi:Brix domain
MMMMMICVCVCVCVCMVCVCERVFAHDVVYFWFGLFVYLHLHLLPCVCVCVCVCFLTMRRASGPVSCLPTSTLPYSLDGVLHCHLPYGPTANYKLSKLVLAKEITGHGKPTRHTPELILNNFNTRLAHDVGRMFAALFPKQPNFGGRRVVTLHNQRDFLFFRHHR